MDVYCHTERTSRKTHVCCECHGQILRGERYHVFHGIFDEEPYRKKQCVDCYTLMNRIVNKLTTLDGEKFSFGQLYEWVFNSRSVEYMDDFISTKKERNAPVIPQWMFKERNASDKTMRMLLTHSKIIDTIIA